MNIETKKTRTEKKDPAENGVGCYKECTRKGL